MSGIVLHVMFDAAAWLAAGLSLLWLKRAVQFPPAPADLSYVAVLMFGAGLGAVAFGTANMWLSGQPGLARSR